MLTELCKFFLILGATGFGGPLSLIQQMRSYFVDQTKQMTASEFDQAFTLIKAMPGPIAFQMAVFCSQKLAGRLAAIASGFCLLLPAFLLMILAGLGYQFLTENIYITQVLSGFQFAVAAVILLSLKTLFKQYYKIIWFWLILVICAAFYWFQILPEPVLIVGFGILCAVNLKAKKVGSNALMFAASVDPDVLWKLLKVCTYASAFVFGTGLALLPVLQQQFVTQYHWLSPQVFNDGVTFGQMTPGPITITATFLGYKIAGLWGAVAATLGIFLLPLIHMLTWFPKVLSWLSRQRWIADFLLGATAAVVGVLLITVFRMNEPFMKSVPFWLIFLSSFIFLISKPKTAIYKIIFFAGFLNLILNLIINFATMNAV